MPRRKNAAEAVEPAATQNQMTETTEKKLPATTSKKGNPVSPDLLLRTASEMEGAPADKIALACGYYTEITTTATGETEVRVTAADIFACIQALLAAQGTKLAPPERTSRRNNRSPIVKIGKTGTIVVGGRYTSVAGFPFGEGVDSRVRIQTEQGKITITGVDASEYASSEVDNIDGDDEEVSDLDP